MSEPSAGVAGPSAASSSLEEERAFLIRSLRDLDAERDAGDIDEEDYRALRDDYTVRAAALLRRLEGTGDGGDTGLADPPAERSGADVQPAAPVEEGPARRKRPRGADGVPAPGADGDAETTGRRRRKRRPWTHRQLAVVGAIVVALAGLGGWEVGHGSSGGSGKALTAAQVEKMLGQAESEVTSNPLAAIKEYNKILAVYPEQPQALTEVGWVYAQAGELTEAQASLEKAETAEPTYDPAHGYLGVVYFGEDNYQGAVTQLTYYLAHGPDPTLAPQAKQALAAAQKDLKATATPASPGTTAPASSTTAGS